MTVTRKIPRQHDDRLHIPKLEFFYATNRSEVLHETLKDRGFRNRENMNMHQWTLIKFCGTKKIKLSNTIAKFT